MEVNFGQHGQSGLNELKSYVEGCLSRQEEYDGKKVVRIVDGFGPILRQHLAEEIPSFDEPRRSDDQLTGFHAKLAAEAKETETELRILEGAILLIIAHDLDYEWGIHTNFPPIPGPITWGLRNVAWWAHRDWWAFAPCDGHGKMRPFNIPPS